MESGLGGLLNAYGSDDEESSGPEAGHAPGLPLGPLVAHGDGEDASPPTS